MDAEFHALTPTDIQRTGNIVRSNATVDPYDTIAMGAGYDASGVERSLATQHTRRVIKLAQPTFNHVLGRSGCTLLSKLLGVPKRIWDGVINYTIIYDKKRKDYVSVTDADKPASSYLYGAQIAEMLIDQLDIEQAKTDCIYGGLGAFCKITKNPRQYFTVKRGSGQIKLVDGYYADYVDDVAECLKSNVTVQDIEADFANVMFPNQNSRYTYLRNMKQDKSGLYGMLNYYIVVVPEEMRPRFGEQDHKLTKLYTKVIQANYNLETNLTTDNVTTMVTVYRALDRATRHVQYKNLDQPGVKPDDMAILERIKSKKGQIRKNNLGKRQDYSGRAVVCSSPFLPLDVIRVPKSMLPKLLEFHILPYLVKRMEANDISRNDKNHLANVYDRLQLGRLDNPEAREEMLRIIEEEHLLDQVPMFLGRQPTLHKQSLQGFYIEETDMQAIEVNPLVCPAFNMDFDGDQAHIEVPLLRESIKEIFDIGITTQNLFLAKTGECTTTPRQDMLYGLWTCTRNTNVPTGTTQSFDSLTQVRKLVMEHKLKVTDRVITLDCRTEMTAGDAAFMSCFPEGDVCPRGTSKSGALPVEEVGKKSVNKYIDHLTRINTDGTLYHAVGKKRASTNTIVGCINALVELGFKVAKIYSPNMSLIIKDIPMPEYDNAIDDFHKAMAETDMYYNIGMETSDNYRVEFSQNLDILNKKRESGILKKLGDDNGYVKLSVSGARGSTSNLLQAFSIKGKVKKNETESFNALLSNSYATQLTPMEHNVAAYGGRQGQIDKSLKTGDTGYAMRQMWHAAQAFEITTEDCGTNDGIRITKKDLVLFSENESQADIQKDVKSIFKHAIAGRYDTSGRFISERMAAQMAEDDSVAAITIRSPITCKNPCCVKCYGIDWSSRRRAAVGLPIGIIAAQSVGEPGTQLTMKQFQKGGVAGKADVTSSFDKVNNYIHVADLAELSKKDKYPGYDPLAWHTGAVKIMPAADITKQRVMIEGSKKSILIPKGIQLKEHAVRGEGLSYRHGDYDLNEIMAYGGTYDANGNEIESPIRAAQKYLMFKLYELYESEVKIKMVHFEVLVAGMTRFMITDTDRDDLMVGQYATIQELYKGRLNNTKFIPRIIGMKNLPNASHDALDSIVMEGQVEGLSRVCLLNMHDTLTKPLNRMVLGLTISNGTRNPNFIPSRKY